MKKHVVITNYDSIQNPYYAGGGAISMHEIGKRLAERYIVTIVSGAYPGSKDILIDGINYHFIGLHTGPRAGQVSYIASLPFYIARLNADCILENFLPPHSTNMLELYTKIPVIGITTILNASSFSKKYHVPFELIESFGIKKYSHIIALTESLKQKILTIHPLCNVSVIPSGISDHLFSIPTSEKPYLAFLGRIDRYQKGLEEMITAWEMIAPHWKRMNLKIAGDGPAYEMEWLNQRIHNSSAQSQIQYLSKIEGNAKEQFLAESTAVIIPSKFESFGMVALESMALGKAIIKFNIPGMTWMEEGTALIASEMNVARLSEIIQTALEQPDLRVKIGLAAKQQAKKYTWDSIAMKYRGVLEEVL